MNNYIEKNKIKKFKNEVISDFNSNSSRMMGF